jgi:hypothetical protein
MRKLWLVGVLFCLVLIAPLVVTGETPSGTPKIDLPRESWDFGKVKEGPVLKHTFTVKNIGTAELELQAYPGCRVCISPELSSNKILPESKAELDVFFYTKGKSGAIDSFAMIRSNDPEQPVLKITVKAFVIEKPVK